MTNADYTPEEIDKAARILQGMWYGDSPSQDDQRSCDSLVRGYVEGNPSLIRLLPSDLADIEEALRRARKEIPSMGQTKKSELERRTNNLPLQPKPQDPREWK